ncbi:hypothetical protein HII36_49125 [Nonomuraea sp. NN258]|uniref:alpha/beta hydrolase n=1 Tax=Nonomuraea antri TaxID=2730852 RepID=UPI001568A215|nr:hypothetical protein [Nonomuraea antri]NRQ39742.1 hypothetical protein [Nonomuraea antri]
MSAAGTARTGAVTSADGTPVGYEVTGAGPAVVLVPGAAPPRMTSGAASGVASTVAPGMPPGVASGMTSGVACALTSGVAGALAPWFSVFTYGGRVAGVEREVEDLVAVIGAAGGPAMVFGGSAGAVPALLAAARCPAVAKLALWEPPYRVGEIPPAPTQPTLVLHAGGGRAWLRTALPRATHRVLDGRTGPLSPATLASELLEFFVTR